MSSNKKKNKKNEADKPFNSVIEDAKNVRDAALASIESLIGAVLAGKKEEEANDSPAEAAPKEKPQDFYKKQTRTVPDKLIPTEDQNFVYGKRDVGEVANSSLFLTRFGYKHAFCNKTVTCDEFHDAETGALVGVIPRIDLDTVWSKAHKWIALGKAEEPKISSLEWDNAKAKLIRYIRRKDRSKETIVRNVMAIPELAFRELYIPRANEAIALIDYAVKYELYETEELRKKWSKIKRYKHKVSLLAANGGIFTSDEVNVLRSLNINYLNDIRRQSIFVLKHYLFKRDFSNIINEINEAFHEDLERRRDKRYKVYPFVVGYAALAVMTVIGYVFKYDLIKDAQDKAIIANVGAVVWIFGLLIMLRGVIRARRRRRTKRPDYRYFTAKVKRAARFLTLFSIFSIGSLLLFFQRYDGYNDHLYYRDLDDGTVAVAGLRNDELTISIPSSIDEKAVTEIDLFAFKGDGLVSVTLPDSVTKIDTGAFKKCDSLTDLGNTASVTEIGKRAFVGCSALETIRFGKLSSVGKAAFSGCSALKTIEFTEPIEQIPDGAFRDCVSIENAASFENVKVVGKNAFRGCTSLKDVNLANVTSIGDKAFYGCTSFENIVVTSVTESIGKNAFTGCTSVKSITVPFIGPDSGNDKNKSFGYIMDSSEKLGESGISVIITDMTALKSKAFNKCSSVRSITLPDSVTTIEEGAFNGAKSLNSVNIPNGVTVLYSSLFENCEDLTTVQGGSDVEIIENNVFGHCTSLVEVSFPNLKSIGDQAFVGCSALKSIGEHSELETIGKAAFRDCNALESISIPTVTSLGESAFANCGSLSSIELGGALGNIPKEAFIGDFNLVTISIPNGITEIGEAAFKNSGVKNISWGDSVTTIGKEAFRAASIEELYIPVSVTSIGKNAFADGVVKKLEAPFIGESADSTKNGFKHVFGSYPQLTDITLTGTRVIETKALNAVKNTVVNITLAEGTEQIAKKAFEGFAHLDSVKLPTTLTKIGDKAFHNCDSLSYVNLENTSLTECGKAAFSSCGVLETITVPDTLKAVPENFAYDSWNLTTVTFESGVEAIGKNAFYNASINSLYLPDSVKSIGESAFANNLSLQTLVLSEGLESIGESAFSSCYYFTAVTIPASVNTIDKHAFAYCSNLVDLNISDGVEKIEKGAFSSCTSLTKVVIPDSVKYLGKDILDGCYNLTTLTVPFVGKSTNETKKITYLTSSFSLSVLEITSAEFVGKKALAGGSMLTTVTFGENVKGIEAGIAEGLYNLNRINLPESLKDCAAYFPSGTVYIDGVLYKSETDSKEEADVEDQPSVDIPVTEFD